jgi:hypothetical protein
MFQVAAKSEIVVVPSRRSLAQAAASRAILSSLLPGQRDLKHAIRNKIFYDGSLYCIHRLQLASIRTSYSGPVARSGQTKWLDERQTFESCLIKGWIDARRRTAFPARSIAPCRSPLKA